MTLAPAHSPRAAARAVCSAPVTALAQVPGTCWAIAAAARDLILLPLHSSQPGTATPPEEHARWTVFERERIHRLVWRPQATGKAQRDQHEALILGGKEAALVQVDLKASSPCLSVDYRFALDDVVGDGAFLDSDRVALVTLHCTLHVYDLLNSDSSPSTSVAAPFLRPVHKAHAPQRPLLWAARFSKPAYYTHRQGERAFSDGTMGMEEELVRVAGGSMWGDAFIWDVCTLGKLLHPAEESTTPAGEPITGSLRRLVGHKGAVFSATFSFSADFLATCSDDRTIRVWDLRRLAADFKSPRSDSSVLPEIDPSLVPHRTLWGHEGRVWWIAFLESETASGPRASSPPPRGEPPALVSVGEDATCWLWRDGKVVETWRDGHDGRSIWSLAVARLADDAVTSAGARRQGRCYVLTGGADGAVRCWPLREPISSHPTTEAASGASATAASAKSQKTPRTKASKVTAFRVADLPSFRESGRETRQVIVTLSGDGSIRARAVSVYSAADTASHLMFGSEEQTTYSSTAFAGSYSSTVIRLLPPLDATEADPPGEARRDLYAFSNRGFLLNATLKLEVDGSAEVEDIKEEMDAVKANDVEFVDFDGEDGQRRRRAVVWERAGHRLVVLDQAKDSSLRETSSFELDRTRPSLLPTCMCFLTHNILLVGSIRGHLLLFRLSGVSPSAIGEGGIAEIGRLERVHSDTINRICVRARQTSASTEGAELWTVETIARDGASCLVEIQVPAMSATSSIQVVDRRQLTKGWLEDFLPHSRYLALVDTRAVILDRLGQILESHRSPSKKSLWQIVSDETGTTRYYRTQDDLLTHIQLGSTPPDPSTLLLGGLHGREIRAVTPWAVPNSQMTLVATAAENGVLTISRLDVHGGLEPLYCDRYLPGSYKALAWSAGASSASETHTLFACGTRASLSALIVTVVIAETGDVKLQVVPAGDELADEGEELRAMDLATVPLHHESPGSPQLVAVGYSDGIIRTWLHSSDNRTFTPLGASTEEGKCILCVKVAAVRLPFEKEARTLLLTSASDGLLSVRDLSSFLRNPTLRSGALPAPFFSFRPHPSGINSVSVRTLGRRLFLATGGDDNAVVLSLLELTAGSDAGSDPTLAEVARASMACAHSSTIQGLDFLNDHHLVSTSVDQRLNLYRCAHKELTVPHKPELSLELIDATCLDVADCSAQAVVRSSDCRGRNRVLVVGIGAELVSI